MYMYMCTVLQVLHISTEQNLISNHSPKKPRIQFFEKHSADIARKRQ